MAAAASSRQVSVTTCGEGKASDNRCLFIIKFAQQLLCTLNPHATHMPPLNPQAQPARDLVKHGAAELHEREESPRRSRCPALCPRTARAGSRLQYIDHRSSHAQNLHRTTASPRSTPTWQPDTVSGTSKGPGVARTLAPPTLAAALSQGGCTWMAKGSKTVVGWIVAEALHRAALRGVSGPRSALEP